jgi:hypothetical protein
MYMDACRLATAVDTMYLDIQYVRLLTEYNISHSHTGCLPFYCNTIVIGWAPIKETLHFALSDSTLK